jgi:hypothetical protein
MFKPAGLKTEKGYDFPQKKEKKRKGYDLIYIW